MDDFWTGYLGSVGPTEREWVEARTKEHEDKTKDIMDHASLEAYAKILQEAWRRIATEDVAAFQTMSIDGFPMTELVEVTMNGTNDPKNVIVDTQMDGPIPAEEIRTVEVTATPNPVTGEADIETKIVAAGKVAPRIRPQDIDDTIVNAHYFTAGDGCLGEWQYRYDTGEGLVEPMEPVPVPLQTLTFCVLVLKNGFTVTGESACASPENFDPAIGREIAYKNAREKIWVLEGYRLKSKLASDAANISESIYGQEGE